MKELQEFLEQEIKEARQYFKNDEHFEEVFNEAGWTPQSMRVFDTGYIKALEAILKKLQNNTN